MAKFYQVKVDNNVYKVEVEFLSENATSAPVAATPAPTPAPQAAAAPAAPVATGGEPVTAPMQGNIWKIIKSVGDTVKRGDTIIILEAMKMENNIVAQRDGTIASILVKEGDTVTSGATLAELA